MCTVCNSLFSEHENLIILTGLDSETEPRVQILSSRSVCSRTEGLVVSLSLCLFVSLSRCVVVSLSRCLVVSLCRCLVAAAHLKRSLFFIHFNSDVTFPLKDSGFGFFPDSLFSFCSRCRWLVNVTTTTRRPSSCAVMRTNTVMK